MAESPDRPSPRSEALKKFWDLEKRAMALKAYWGSYYETTDTHEEKAKLKSKRKKDKLPKGETMSSPSSSTNKSNMSNMLLMA